jgi:hypothetical protein
MLELVEEELYEITLAIEGKIARQWRGATVKESPGRILARPGR